MSVEPTRLQYLLQQYANNVCTRQELLELFQAIEAAQQDEAWESSLHDIWQNISASDPLPAIDKEKIFNEIITEAAVPVLPNKKRVWWKAAAAAVVIVVAAWVLYAWLHTSDKKPVQQPLVAKNNFKNDVAPGGDKAILTLSDGSTIILDSAHNGSLAEQGNTKVNKPGNGRLEYYSIPQGGSNGQSAIVGYNTLVVPRGGQYQVVLPDGTKVWLNAASSLKYPTAFTGNERVVELTGEAYFEVTHVQSTGGGRKPFIVSILPSLGSAKPAGRVEVLGTHFNINAYGDEEAIKTTLLEGSVKVASGKWPVASGNSEVMLQPGEQAELGSHSPLTINHSPNLNVVVAWKNGLFDFRSADIYTVMRQLSRWYDIEVNYQSAVKDRFYAKIPRNTKLSDVLQALTMTGSIHFQIEGKKVIVF